MEAMALELVLGLVLGLQPGLGPGPRPTPLRGDDVLDFPRSAMNLPGH